MESYLPISFLNDFTFCPRSIYFHQLYREVGEAFYKTDVQIKGETAHKSIDGQSYTTSTKILQAIEIYSANYRLCGKIDLYDQEKKLLIERKKKIKMIYDGYIFQVYAQYHCLSEMGFTVNAIKLHSLDDNKNYTIPTPPNDPNKQLEFEQLVTQIHNHQLLDTFIPNPNKCNNCIYRNLCDRSLATE